MPFLIKDVFGHEKGRKIEFGSRLCAGMTVEVGTYFADLLKASGVNILGRSAAPEYSMAATTESAMFGNTSNPWKQGYSAGGSTGGGQAAVIAGIVPIAHGSDIGGSIRIPASWCGGVGLKPSRMRVSSGPVVDEGGWGYSMNFVQTKTVRDAAAMLDCVAIPQPGDPFIIPKPDEPYASLARKPAPKLRIGIVLDELVGMKVDPEVAARRRGGGKDAGRHGPRGGAGERRHGRAGRARRGLRHLLLRLRLAPRRLRQAQRPQGRSGHAGARDPLGLRGGKGHHAGALHRRHGAANVARRKLGAFYTKYDIWLSPTTSRVSEPWGRYNLSRPGAGAHNMIDELFKPPCQYTLPHNIMGTPAMSLPLAMHSTGVPIGVQIAAKPAAEHLLLQLAAGARGGHALEGPRPAAARVEDVRGPCMSIPLLRR